MSKTNKLVNLFIENLSSSYTQYRFNQISNFLIYKDFQKQEAIDEIIRIGKELEIMERFKSLNDEDLHSYYFDLQKLKCTEPNLVETDFEKQKHYEAKQELDRRGIGWKNSLSTKQSI